MFPSYRIENDIVAVESKIEFSKIAEHLRYHSYIIFEMLIPNLTSWTVQHKTWDCIRSENGSYQFFTKTKNFRTRWESNYNYRTTLNNVGFASFKMGFLFHSATKWVRKNLVKHLYLVFCRHPHTFLYVQWLRFLHDIFTEKILYNGMDTLIKKKKSNTTITYPDVDDNDKYNIIIYIYMTTISKPHSDTHFTGPGGTPTSTVPQRLLRRLYT